MAQQRGPQNRKLLVGLQTAEAPLGLQHGSCSPAQSHSRIAPTFDVATDLPQHGHQALDRVGAAERAPQFVRQTEADHGEHFIQPFVDRSRDAGGIVIEPTRQVPENPFGLLGGRTIPSLTQHLLDPGVQRRVEPLDDIAARRSAIRERPFGRWGDPGLAFALSRLRSACRRAEALAMLRAAAGVVERQLPKLYVVGSIPIARSNPKAAAGCDAPHRGARLSAQRGG
jgi:hypothetical protein